MTFSCFLGLSMIGSFVVIWAIRRSPELQDE